LHLGHGLENLSNRFFRLNNLQLIANIPLHPKH